jgi:hypothetical protein
MNTVEMKIYHLQLDEDGRWELLREVSDTAYKVVKKFEDYKDVIKSVQARAEKKLSYEIYDHYFEITITVELGEIKSVRGYWEGEVDYSEQKIAWGVMKPRDEEDEDHYEPSCSRCGDGGCFWCEPHRFI